MIESIEKQNVVDIVFHKMLDMIIEGYWKQGALQDPSACKVMVNI